MTDMEAIMILMPTEVTRTFDATEDTVYMLQNQVGLWVNNVRGMDGNKGDHLCWSLEAFFRYLVSSFFPA